MWRIIKLYILVSLHYNLIQCLIPSISSELSVRPLDEKLIERKRQDTMDMCRIFTEETKRLEKGHEMYHNNVRGHRRSKRELSMNVINPMMDLEDAQRVENIVDQLYDDLSEKGEKVKYRRVDVEALELNGTFSSNMTGRRFNFAPNLIVGPKPPTEHHLRNGPPPPGKTPRFKLSIVPYFIDRNTYDPHLSDIIMKAFDYFERATCIRLQRLHERPTDKASLQKVEWLYITNPTGIRQCVHSNERTLLKGVQMVVLGYDCMSNGDIIHELMHVLGFSHEHSRPDRDKYISVLWNNIKPGYKKYFELHEKPDVENMPYDYASVMHYPARAFSKNGQATLKTEPGIKIGQREGLSEIDVQKVSMMYSAECVKRNRQYLLKTCPSVVKAAPEPKKVTEEEIDEYYKNRLWAYGIVNYKLSDQMEFSHDEKENIMSVIRHIEAETCIEFRDLTPDLNEKDSDENNDSGETYHTKGKGKQIKFKIPEHSVEKESEQQINTEDESIEPLQATKGVTKYDKHNTRGPGDMLKKPHHKEEEEMREMNKGIKKKTKKNKKLRTKRAVPISPSRRHATNVLVFTRSPKPGCACPKTPGIPGSAQAIIEINADCFNSVNILLHLFVHLLGLDHQHNSHDRDSFLHIVWDQLTDDVKEEMKQKVPPAASAGFAYDYQSVMHYPWLQIKNGRTNIMYPIWNDGWAMGNWQGLSSVDVQKLNRLYKKQCDLRKQEAAAVDTKLRSLTQ